MIFQLNKRGKILSVKKEDNSGENFAALSGYNFVSLVAQGDATVAAQFLNDLKDGAEFMTCDLGLSLEHNSSPRYHCIGVSTGDDSLCIIARRKEPAEVNVDAMNSQLADAKQQVRVLFGKLPVALLVVNKNCMIEALNPTTEKLFGYTPEAWRQMHLNKLFEGFSELSNEFLFNRMSENPGKISRLDAFKADGEKLPVEVSAEFIDASKTKLLLSLFDISERIKLEQLKKEFVEMVSHDLRTPLSNLVLFLESITMGFHKKWTDEKLRGNAERNFEEVSRLIRLINKLLDIDKLEEGFAKPEFKRVLLTDAIESAVNAVNPTAMKNGISFGLDFPDRLVMADPDQLAQILINLLGNAVKFSPTDTRITINVVDVAGGVEVTIRDQGPGIPAHLKDHIFERFGQVKSAKSKEGSGLGLAICKALVEAHGGTLGVRSEEGDGSEFWFRLPAHKEEADKASSGD